MTMTVLEIMRSASVIPVIAIDDPEHAVPLAKALVAGGIRVLEVTLRTAHGLAGDPRHGAGRRRHRRRRHPDPAPRNSLPRATPAPCSASRLA